MEVKTVEFESRIGKKLQWSYSEGYDPKLDLSFSGLSSKDKDRVNYTSDPEVVENNSFEYEMVLPDGKEIVEKVVILLHGFNEKRWKKYRPWARQISNETGAGVVLFPIAFHMQRAPKVWSEKMEMDRIHQKRKGSIPSVAESSLYNVSISSRLHALPSRFISSGLQTYFDIIQLVEECKSDKHPLIQANSTFDFFGYSVGGVLAQVLKLSNHKNYFTDSKVCLFCSGATLSQTSPVSKFIIDSEANAKLNMFIEEKLQGSERPDSPVVNKVFDAMLNYETLRTFREGLLKKNEHDIYAIVLEEDSVFPPSEVVKALQGTEERINIRVDKFDFESDYSHEIPFPENGTGKQKDVEMVFSKISEFLSKKCPDN